LATLSHYKSRLFHCSGIMLLVHLSTSISTAPIEWVYVKSDTGGIMKIWGMPNMVRIGQKYRGLYTKP